MSEKPYEALGEYLRGARLRKGYTQLQVAGMVGCGRLVVVDIETCRRAVIDVNLLVDLCVALDVDVRDAITECVL